MKNLEKPLTWLLGIAFIAYIGISNLCSDQNNSDVLKSSQSNFNMPVLQETESNINQPVLEKETTEEITTVVFEELYDSNAVIVNDSSDLELESIENQEEN